MPFRFPETDMMNGSEFVENNKLMLACLDKMPAAMAIIQLEVEEPNIPVDFKFVYANEALAKLERVPLEKLVGASFYKDIFPNGDKKWLLLYWDVACNGGRQTLKDYSPEIGRFLETRCYQIAYGYCACIIVDVSDKIRVQRELEDARHCMELIFKNTLDYMFFYDIDNNVLINDSDILPPISNLPLRLHNVPKQLVDYGIIKEKSFPEMENLFKALHKNPINSEIGGEFELNLDGRHGNFQWYKLTFISYFSELFDKRYIIALMHNINEEIALRRQLENEASRDGLTGLYNRKTAIAMLNSACHGPNGKALFLFDLDDFKSINDTYGHTVGDRTLQIFGKILGGIFQKNDIVFRLGGDEFGAFAQADSENFVDNICKRIFERLKEQKELPFQICASIGVGWTLSSHYSYMEYYQIADKALYAAKNSGKNIWRVETFS